MKIYTKTGDKGKTSLYDGNVVRKTSYVFDVLGDIDELSSRLGIAISFDENNIISEELRTIQKTLQDINSILATYEKQKRKNLPSIDEENINHLEQSIDVFTENTPPLTQFILPGVTPVDSYLHLCRSQTRKIERMLWMFVENHSIEMENKTIHNQLDTVVLRYFNRLSDFFFAAARYVCVKNGQTDCFL